MVEIVRSYDCGCDFGEDFAHLCRTAANLEADQHFAESDVWGAITGAQHLVDDANRDEWAEVIGIGSSHDMREAAKHLRKIAAEIEKSDQRIREYMNDIAEGICPQCESPNWSQVGRCVYCNGCGHRLYQGTLPEAKR